MSKNCLWMSMICLGLVGCASPGDNSPLNIPAVSQTLVSPAQLRLPTELTAVAAEYETTVSSESQSGETPQKTYRWRFWRAAQRIETENLQDNSGEVWLKLSDGKIAYEQLFHEQKQVIEYQPADLDAIGYKTDWPSLGALLNPVMTASLYADHDTEILGKPARHYRTKEAAPALEVIWLAQEQLPALIKSVAQNQTVVTRLIGSYPLSQSPWPYQRSANYRYIDFADLGDKESDPIIKSIQYKIRAAHTH